MNVLWKKLADGKLIALGEIGQVPTAEQLTTQPYWSGFMTWGYFIDKYIKPEVVKAATTIRPV